MVSHMDDQVVLVCEKRPGKTPHKELKCSVTPELDCDKTIAVFRPRLQELNLSLE